MHPWLRVVPWYLYPALPWALAMAWVDYWRDRRALAWEKRINEARARTA